MLKKYQWFNELLLKDYEKNIKAIWIVLDQEPGSYVVLLDNLGMPMEKQEFLFALQKLKVKCNIEFNLQVYELTHFFKRITANDLLLLREMKHASPVYDPVGFFVPLKNMVEKGQILGTHDSVQQILDKVKDRFSVVEGYKKQILFNTYRAVVDAGYAALVARNYSLPVQHQLPHVLKEHFVKRKILEKVYVTICDEIIQKYRAFEKGNLRTISGKELGEFHNAAFAFVDRMKTLVGEGFSGSDAEI